MSTEKNEEVTNLPTKTDLTVMGDHLDGSSTHGVIDVLQFHY